MRVITGTAKGRRLETLEGEDVRPTTERIKEAVFSIIQFEIMGHTFLDLFAGSGQMGIEAISRGASSAYFVDASKKSLDVVRKNVSAVKFDKEAKLFAMDYRSFLSMNSTEFDIAFLDPPYKKGILQDALPIVAENMRETGIIIAENPLDEQISANYGDFVLDREYRYGKIKISTFRHKDFFVMKKTVICPGSFDPVTLGHIDIIKRAANMFDKVIVGVFTNEKKTPSFSAEERIQFLKESTAGIENVEIVSYSGLLAQYCKERKVDAIVKGLRAVSDFEYEFQQALTNKRLNPQLETIFLTAESESMYLSSSMVRTVASLGGDISNFVPEMIHDRIVERLYKKEK